MNFHLPDQMGNVPVCFRRQWSYNLNAFSCYNGDFMLQKVPRKCIIFGFLKHLEWNVAPEIRIFSWRTNRRKHYPVVRAGITVVQNFQASLDQRSCLILCELYLVLCHLPHQGLQKHKHMWWVHITRVFNTFYNEIKDYQMNKRNLTRAK